MRISYQWIKDFVETDAGPEEIADILTSTGLEVESIEAFESIRGGLKNVIIGEVLQKDKHPDADKLSVCRVNVGGEEALQIVCGAPNVAAGQKVIVALNGASLHTFSSENIVIKKAKIRGVESNGMICAEDEIGLGNSHDGIMILPADAPVGTAAADYLGLYFDTIFEIGLTPNRSDAMCHKGVARDLIAVLKTRLRKNGESKSPYTEQIPKPHTQDGKIRNIVIEDQDACLRYSGINIQGIQLGPSPDWLKNRLQAVGVKSINNVVDITNYVMLELGQPLHAFDADKLNGDTIFVKHFPAEREFTCLDGQLVKLQQSDLLIADEKGPLCIAGIYGGAESGISEGSLNIFLESAHFSPSGIRKTASRLNLKTESSSRFEKGADPNATLPALYRAAQLICDIAGGHIASDVLDCYPKKQEELKIKLHWNKLNSLCGFIIQPETVSEILTALDYRIDSITSEFILVAIPTFRRDVSREADLVEEILRIYGLDQVPLPNFLRANLQSAKENLRQKRVNAIGEMLAGIGFRGIMTNSIASSKTAGDKQAIMLLNSMTSELDSMRTSMLPAFLDVIRFNLNHKNENLKLFEFGKTYSLENGGFREDSKLCLACCGQVFSESPLLKSPASEFLFLKAAVEAVLNKLGVRPIESERTELKSPYSYSLSYETQNKNILADVHAISKTELLKAGIKQDVFFAELNWTELLKQADLQKIEFRELPKFPSVRRDLALVLDQHLTYRAVRQIAERTAKKLLEDVNLFDEYVGDKIGSGKKSCAVSFLFRSSEKTMTEAEIDQLMQKLRSNYEKELGAVIRS